MANMSLKKNPMPHQDPVVRAGNFDEVALGYTKEQAIDEAARCLNCKNMPCVSGCPVQIRIPEFIAKVAEGDFEAAYQIISQDSALPAVCVILTSVSGEPVRTPLCARSSMCVITSLCQLSDSESVSHSVSAMMPVPTGSGSILKCTSA